jgi:hypothetical protein
MSRLENSFTNALERTFREVFLDHVNDNQMEYASVSSRSTLPNCSPSLHLGHQPEMEPGQPRSMQTIYNTQIMHAPEDNHQMATNLPAQRYYQYQSEMINQLPRTRNWSSGSASTSPMLITSHNLFQYPSKITIGPPMSQALHRKQKRNPINDSTNRLLSAANSPPWLLSPTRCSMPNAKRAALVSQPSESTSKSASHG